MPELPEVSEAFVADVTDYVQKIQELIDKTTEASESVANLRREIEELPRETEVVVRYVRETVGEAPDTTDVTQTVTTVTEGIGPETSEQLGDIAEEAGRVNEELAETSDDLEAARAAAADFAGEGEHLSGALDDASAHMGEARESAEELAESLGDAGDESAATFAAFDAWISHADRFKASTEDAADTTRDLGTAADTAASLLSGMQAPAEGAASAVSGTGKASKDTAEDAAGLFGIFATNKNMMSDFHGLWSLLTADIKLYGGALENLPVPNIVKQVSVWHLLLDAIVETSGTLIPAAIAFGAFGIAAIGPVEALYEHMTDVSTVSKALGQNIYPLTGGFEKLGDAVKPEVYILFGEALEELGHKTSTFSDMATGAGQVLDGLGARFVVATTEGGGFSTFVTTAVKDLQEWGTVIGNIGGIIGNVLKDLPGFAEMFLNMAVGVTHFIEVLTGAIGPVLEFAIAMHGIILYAGLAFTAIVLLANPIQSLVLLIGPLITGMYAWVAGILAVGASEGVTSAATAVLTSAMAALDAVSPIVWVGLAVAALVALGIAVSDASGDFGGAAQQAKDFGTAMQNAVSGSSITNFSSTLNSAMDQTKARLAGVNGQIAAVTESMSHMSGNTDAVSDRLTGDYNPALVAAENRIRALKAEAAAYNADLQVFEGDQKNYNDVLAQLDPITGSAAASLNGLNAAGITSQDITSASASQLKEYVVEVVGYDDAVRAATDSTGRYAAAENALAYENGEASSQLGVIDSAMSKVTQAQTDLVSTITGGESSLVTFRQGIQTLGQDSENSSASMNGLTGSSLQLQSDFYSGVNSLQAMISATELQGASTKNLTAIVATGAGSLLTYAGNNTAAQSSIVALINNALGPGTVSLQSLNKWVGTNSTSQQGLSADVGATTVAAGKLANTLSGDLNAIMATSITDAYGGQQAFDAFAKGVLNGNTNSQDFYNSASDVVGILLKQSGDSLPKAKSAFESYAENGLGLSKSQTDNLWKDIQDNLTPQIKNAEEKLGDWPKNEGTTFHMSGTGGAKITANVAGFSIPGGGGVRITGYAGGGVLPGYDPGHDSIHAMLSPGEGVLIPQATRALGGEQGIRAINKNYQHFADGGVAATDAVSSAAQMAADSGRDMTLALGHAATNVVSYMQKHISQELSSALGTVGHLSASQSAVASLMAVMAAAQGWTGAQLQALLSVEQREAGFNPNAKNPSSGAYGLAQFINGPSEYYQYGGNPNTVAGQITAMLAYVKQRYGTPEGALASEVSRGYYDQGGWLQPGWTMALNNTGQAEKITAPNGSGPGEGGMVHAVFQIDGKNVVDAIAPAMYQKAARNRGNANASGYFAPGSGPNGSR